ncbi:MAG TPA: phosphoribosylanthranilate isomerase, partial [Caulobacteraceae bacterium]|nr:phosphoribosylanthranilate isomerase [Caulobacteraceae bacterium]
MPAPVKICGLSTPQTVRAAVEGGADYVGFMFFDKSPRRVTPQVAARLAEPARAKGVKVVAVTVDPSDDLLEELRETLKPDLLQLHGKETPSRVWEAAIKAHAGAVKAISVASPADLDAASQYEAITEHLMFDAKTPEGSDRPGGVGAKFDWTMLSGRRYARPWFLAGGLDPWNVAEAIAASGAPMVDVSSGVERGAGLKDPGL